MQKKRQSNYNLNLSQIMRISFMFCTLLCTTCIVLASNKSYGQKELDRTIQVNFKSVSLKTVLEELQTRYQIPIAYSNSESYLDSKVNYSGKKKAKDVLNEILKVHNMTYELRHDYVRLISNKEPAVRGHQATQHLLTGYITNDNGQPLQGVTVTVKDKSSLKTTTDFNGRFVLNVPNGSTIVASLMGHITQEILVGNEKDIHIKLEEDLAGIEEVVIVGYGVQKKESNVGSQATIKRQELKVPVANLSTAIAGRLAGVVATQRGGGPGSGGADLFVRGIATFSSSPQKPLLVVDGVPDREIDNIDPEDIESFTVLKDATATAVYGTRGANGVIIINTRRGKAGKAVITAEANQGIVGFTYLPKFVDAPTYMKLYNEGIMMRGRPQTEGYADEIIAKHASGEDPDLYPNVNWYDVLFKDYGNNNRLNLNMSGGADIAQYYLSVGYYGEVGQFKTDDIETFNAKLKQDRFNFTSNTNINLTKTTKVDFGLNGYITNLNRPAYGINDLFVLATASAPHVIPARFSNGQWPQVKGLLQSPYMALTQSGVNNRYDNAIRSNLRVTQELGSITEGLRVSGMFAFDVNSQNSLNRERTLQTYFATGRDADGELMTEISSEGSQDLRYSLSRYGDRRFYGEASVNYNRTFANKHEVGGLFLFNQSDYIDATYRVNNYTAAIPYRQRNFVGRGTYGYDSRYLAEANFSYSGSDNFAPANRYGFFPSIGVGWIASNEQFFSDLKNTISHLKFRYSYGVSGNAAVNDPNNRFLYLNRFARESTEYAIGDPGSQRTYKGYNESQIGGNVRWESSYRHNLGIEINFFNNELSLITELFKEDRSGILMRDLTVPYASGYTTGNLPFMNIGKTSNKGIDLTLEWNKKFKNDSFIMARGTFNYNTNLVVQDNLPPFQYPWQDREGHRISQRFGYIAEGLFKSEEELAISPRQDGDVRVGDIKYKDLNGDGVINASDTYAIGYGDTPLIIYGITLAGGYKGFDFSMFFQGAGMVDLNMSSGYGITPFPTGATYGNLYESILDRWDPENPDKKTLYPRLSTSQHVTTNYQSSSWWIKRSDYLRLKQAEIGYNFTDKALLKRLAIQKLRIFTNGTNLFTISDWKLWDPELGDGRGVVYPNTRVFNLGLRINFQ
ncbi:SusC/RagA family TonB-linked outer membrane protein [Sphingobacterium faecale]|uniref:TonB-dependent receptor n=1 Tax=Sphingobacterium faecale TaxID=2803775 RepID=A0ABS1RB83_9SPHI|nr:TonB-dependent receptor [Sphingobacterium faecale]MBL1411489.1 TonB-dependent receptor [Sphingobacterium faecale]